MKYLLLDTNIYLHYIDFEQIDWGMIIGDKEYEIVVPYTVIKEIDKYKDGPKSKIKVRAKAVASKFGCYFLNDDYNKQINLVQINDPSDEILIRYHLNRSVCDDLIIGSILEFEHKDDVIVISHDNTLLIKAKNLGLKFLPKMPDKYLISEEKSEEEKEHERCRKELEQLKNRQPKPQILFANGETVLRIKAPSVSNVDRKLEEIMIKIKSKNPKANIHTTIHEDISPSDIFNDMLNSLNRFQYSIYSDDQLRKHNIELDKFYAYCERFYRFKLESELLEGQLKELSFIISNSGSAETGEMNIFLDFPGATTFAISKSLTSLVRFGLISIPYGTYINDENLYKKFYEHPLYQRFKELYPTENVTVEKGKAVLTPLGSSFVKSCIPD